MEGDAVEVYSASSVKRSRRDWRRGQVELVRSDGSVDVVYSDGERDRRLRSSRLREPESADSDDSDGSYRSDSEKSRRRLQMWTRVEARLLCGGGRRA